MKNLTLKSVSLKDQLATIETSVMNKLIQLRSRWEDEKEYEDFNDYAEAMQKHFESQDFSFYTKFVKASKKPFGFYFTVKDDVENIEVQYIAKITLTTFQIKYDSIIGQPKVKQPKAKKLFLRMKRVLVGSTYQVHIESSFGNTTYNLGSDNTESFIKCSKLNSAFKSEFKNINSLSDITNLIFKTI